MRWQKYLIPVFLICFGCQRAPVVPSELLGTWETTDTKYKDRYLKLDARTMAFGVGPKERPIVQTIQRVSAASEGSSVTYTIYSNADSGGEEKITLIYSPLNGGELRLSNPRQVVWKKAHP